MDSKREQQNSDLIISRRTCSHFWSPKLFTAKQAWHQHETWLHSAGANLKLQNTRW